MELGKVNSTVRCTEKDVIRHLNLLISINKKVDKNIAEKAMYKAVKENTAYKIGEYSFFYYLKTDKEGHSKGVALYSKNPLNVIKMFYDIFVKDYDENTKILKIFPHGKEAIDYRSILLKDSFMLWRQNKRNYVIIRIDIFKGKLLKVLSCQP